MFGKYPWLWAALAFIGLALIFHFSSTNIADLDSFYYMGQARALLENGIFNVAFPWLPVSMIGQLSSSLWYGFGLALIPFSFLGTAGIKIAGVILTTAVLFIYYLVIRRHQLKAAFLWPFLLFFAAPNVLTQLLMVRPQTVSVMLSPLLFSFLLDSGHSEAGPRNLKRSFAALRMTEWGALLTAFAMSWIHLNMVWLIILILGVVISFRFLAEKRCYWQVSLATLAGAMLGWLARPNPIGAIKLFYVQVVQQIFEKQGGLPLLFGKENFPLAFSTLLKNFSPLIILWAAALLLLVWFMVKKLPLESERHKVFLLSSLILAFIFFIITVFVTRRAYNFWAVFGILFAAGAYTYLLPRFNLKSLANGFLAILLVFLIFYSGIKGVAAIERSGYAPDELRESALWLKENSAAGDFVFNVHWSDFSPLFFWNRHNYYVGGLDPIFQYSFNPELYWQFHYLSGGITTGFTCAMLECNQDTVEDTYEVLKNNFNTKYVLVGKADNPDFDVFLRSDPRFKLEFDGEKEAVYLVK